MTRTRSLSADYTPDPALVKHAMKEDYEKMVSRVHELEQLDSEGLVKQQTVLMNRLAQLEGGDVPTLTSTVMHLEQLNKGLNEQVLGLQKREALLANGINYLTRATGIYGWMTPNGNYVSFLTTMNPDHVPTADEGARSTYVTGLRGEIESLKKQLEDTVISPAKLRHLKACESRCAELEAALEEAKQSTPEELEVALNRVSDLETDNNRLTEMEAELRSTVEDLRGELDTATENLKRVSMEFLRYDDNSASVGELEDKVKELEGQNVSLMMVNEELEATITSLQHSADVDTHDRLRDQLKSAINALQLVRDEHSSNQSTLRSQEMEMSTVREALVEACTSRDDMQTKLAEARLQLVEMERSSEALSDLNKGFLGQIRKKNGELLEAERMKNEALEAVRRLMGAYESAKAAMSPAVLEQVIDN